MDIMVALIVFACALITRLVLYIVIFSKHAAGKLKVTFLIMYLIIFLGAGITFDILLVFLIQDALILELKNPAFFIAISVVIEIILSICSNRIAGFFTKEARKSDEEKPARYKCDDGHVVKSRAEALIDNWLEKEGITHEYEPKLTLEGNNIRPDWYLPDSDVYIEFWGFIAGDNKNYDDRKKHKERFVGLVSIDLEDINVSVKKKLEGLINKTEQKKEISQPRVCYNCGAKLDDRYR